MPGSIVLHPRPVSSESVNIIKGVARPANSGPRFHLKSRPITSIPTKPDRGVFESDSVFATALIRPSEGIARTEEPTNKRANKRNIKVFKFFTPLTGILLLSAGEAMNLTESLQDPVEMHFAFPGNVRTKTQRKMCDISSHYL